MTHSDIHSTRSRVSQPSAPPHAKHVRSSRVSIIPSAKLHKELTHNELWLLGAAGAKVLHPSALEGPYGTRVPIRIRNTMRFPSDPSDLAAMERFDAEFPGTLVVTRNNNSANANSASMRLLGLVHRPHPVDPHGFCCLDVVGTRNVERSLAGDSHVHTHDWVTQQLKLTLEKNGGGSSSDWLEKNVRVVGGFGGVGRETNTHFWCRVVLPVTDGNEALKEVGGKVHDVAEELGWWEGFGGFGGFREF